MMVSLRAIFIAVVAGAVRRRQGRFSGRRGYCRSRCSMPALAEGEAGNNVAEWKTLPALPPPESCWALVTGATTPTGCHLAKLCVQQGFGVVIVDYERCKSKLDELAKELQHIQTRHGGMQRVHAAASDLETSTDVELLCADVKTLGYDVAVLIAGCQVDHTDGILQHSCETFLKSMSDNIAATAGLCKLFAADMVAHGRGRILLTGTGAESARASTIFTNAVFTSLVGELSTTGVGISFLELAPGSFADVSHTLEGTCLGFMVHQPSADGPAATEELRSEHGAEKTSSEDDVDEDSGDAVVLDEYTRLAKEWDFAVLPFAQDIDAWQRYPPVELANAALAGLACILFAVNTLPAFPYRDTVTVVEDVITALFAIDYVLRWYSRGLSPSYLLNQYMLFDIATFIPPLLPLLLPGFKIQTLNFLRLLRTARVYRLLQPRRVKELGRDLFGIDPDSINVTAYQLQLTRSFGVVFTLIFIVAGLMYTAEHEVNPQLPDFFSSLYFSIISLSTVGFGDIAPITPIGRLILSLSIPAGLIVVPYQANEIAAAFAEEERQKTIQLFNRQAEKDEQIQKLINKLEEETKRGNASAEKLQELEKLQGKTSMKDLRDMFNKYDADGSGEIGFSEFALMAEELGIV